MPAIREQLPRASASYLRLTVRGQAVKANQQEHFGCTGKQIGSMMCDNKSVNYYEVLVASQSFHGDGALTYCSDKDLQAGHVVVIPLQKRQVMGVVMGKVIKPGISVKPVSRVISEVPLPEQMLPLLFWINSYYPAPLGSVAALFLPSYLRQVSRQKENHIGVTASIEPPVMSDDQEKACKSILESDKPHFILHGDTGSGKTRIYIELSRQALRDNKSALLLTPEISLTPQLAQEASEVFGNFVVILHSDLSASARRNAWLRILESDKPLVVIGPRSALFSPIHNLGLVVIDEFHDSAYKQEQAPHYLASRIGAKLSGLNKAKLVLGSATPSITDYYLFKTKDLPIIRMEKRAIPGKTEDTKVKIVNIRERTEFTRSSWLSNTLLRKIESCLSSNEQSLVFLNRRGTARLVLCQNCSWQALCPRCDLPLTYHGDTHFMRCHTCGYYENAPSACPTCQTTEITFKSIGTKALYDELCHLYPKARIQRFDSDNKKDESLESLYDYVKSGEVDVIVGTQLLSKGLDLPKLSAVGIVAADTNLYFPDYTASERTFQMLSQIMGRVNRGHLSGSVVIQTYYPNSPLIKAAINKNYLQYYEQDVQERQNFNFPPFCYVLKIKVSRSSRVNAQTASKKLAENLRNLRMPVKIIGPSPSFFEKVRSRYCWQLVVKAKSRQSLTSIIKQLPANCTYDIDPTDLL